MWIAIAFIAFITIASIGATIHGTIRHKDKLDLIRFAMEKGHPIDPAVIDKLMQPEHPPQQPETSAKKTAMGLRIGAIMCFALGIGLAVLGYFLAYFGVEVVIATRAAGAFLVCIAAGLLIASFIVLRTDTSSDKDKSA